MMLTILEAYVYEAIWAKVIIEHLKKTVTAQLVFSAYSEVNE